jgi:polar amino acid transport system substrate-binding protein
MGSSQRYASCMLLRLLLARMVLVIALIGVPSAAIAENDALDHITQTGKVKVAVPDNFPPFGDLGPDGKLQGYDIDTAALITDALGVELELIPVSSTDRLPYLMSGKADLLISSLGQDAAREKVIDFSIAYAPFFSAIFGAEHLAVAKPEDLAGKSIAVTRATKEDSALTMLAPKTATVKRYDDNGATEIAYLSGQAELIATANITAAEILAKSPLKKTAIKFVLQNSPCHIGIPKGEPRLLGRVNQIIAAARNDGSLNKISERWLKAPLGDPEHPEGIIGGNRRPGAS